MARRTLKEMDQLLDQKDKRIAELESQVSTTGAYHGFTTYNEYRKYADEIMVRAQLHWGSLRVVRSLAHATIGVLGSSGYRWASLSVVEDSLNKVGA